jgi:deoxycytidylate deaminase
MKKMINIAYKATGNSTHANHQMAAIIIRGGAILSVAANTCGPGDLESYKGLYCCERKALRKHVDYSGATLIVVRANGKCSKPCTKCAVLIKAAKIKRVVYVNMAGKLVTQKI